VSSAVSSYTRTMRIAVGSDHAGFDLKADLARHLTEAGHEVFDFGTDSAAVSVDYPIYGIAVARAVAEGRAERGVCVCGTGIGISISANKVRGVRAALVHDTTSAALARRHGDANVICLGGRTTATAQAIDVVDTFISTAFEGGRHARRVAQISEYESSDGVFEVNRTPVSGGGTNSKTITTTDSSSLL
jgi:ribose 5-phosphate isomerase B